MRDVTLHTTHGLPDGEYPALWGGYYATLQEKAEVRFRGKRIEFLNLQFQTSQGIRTIAAPAIITICGGKGTVRDLP